VSDSQPLAGIFEIAADQQRLPAADHVFRERIAYLALALGEFPVVANLEFETDLFRFLKRNIKVAGIENLSQLDLDRAKDLILVQPRADGLPDLG